MKVLVVGSGGREHALAWKLKQSPLVTGLYCAPGNPGTASLGTNVPIAANAVESIAQFARKERIDFVVVGPEEPLVLGMVDRLGEIGILAFGPKADGARIEGSKAWAKEIMESAGVPTARAATFSSYDSALRYALSQPLPIVIKADGLAAGKGVIIARSPTEIEETLDRIFKQKSFGAAGNLVVIEEFLSGLEVSMLALVDGKKAVPLIPACDYKAVFDDNRGPNTGGMGSYAPPRFIDPATYAEIARSVLTPVVDEFIRRGIDYRGILYAGLMLTADGPKVLEFNARFGDPETQVVLPLLESDLCELMLAVANGNLDPRALRWHEGACCGVVLASDGYPGDYPRGLPISGLESLDPDVVAFHAGTKQEGDRLVTAGGRVLCVVARGKTMGEAMERSYANIARVSFTGMHYRHDIARRELS